MSASEASRRLGFRVASERRLRRRQNRGAIGEPLALVAAHHGGGELANQIGSSPKGSPTRPQRRSRAIQRTGEKVQDAGGGHFYGGDAPDLLDQLAVPGGGHAQLGVRWWHPPRSCGRGCSRRRRGGDAQPSLTVRSCARMTSAGRCAKSNRQGGVAHGPLGLSRASSWSICPTFPPRSCGRGDRQRDPWIGRVGSSAAGWALETSLVRLGVLTKYEGLDDSIEISIQLIRLLDRIGST